MRLETLAVHTAAEPDAHTGAIAQPLVLSTTYRHGPAGERAPGGFEYIREASPTVAQLEQALAVLERGAAAVSFASGMAAIHALLSCLPRGGEVLIPLDVYHGVRVLGAEFLSAQGIDVRAVDMRDAAAVRAAIGKATRALWVETPSNPRMHVCDIAALAELARGAGVALFCDNTFASPALQNPLALGADVVMHSTTKYLGGHSDVMGGALVFAQRGEWYETSLHRRHVQGAVLAPFNAWLTLRGIRTLPARMAWHCRNAHAVANFLAEHAGVERVNYPGLATDGGHAVARAQMRDFGGMLSAEFRGGRESALRVAGRLRVFTNATSLGGVESLVEHRASVEGANPMSPQSLLRFSVGLEHPDDLVDDLRQALA